MAWKIMVVMMLAMEGVVLGFGMNVALQVRDSSAEFDDVVVVGVCVGVWAMGEGGSHVHGDDMPELFVISAARVRLFVERQGDEDAVGGMIRRSRNSFMVVMRVMSCFE